MSEDLERQLKETYANELAEARATIARLEGQQNCVCEFDDGGTCIKFCAEHSQYKERAKRAEAENAVLKKQIAILENVGKAALKEQQG